MRGGRRSAVGKVTAEARGRGRLPAVRCGVAICIIKFKDWLLAGERRITAGCQRRRAGLVWILGMSVRVR